MKMSQVMLALVFVMALLAVTCTYMAMGDAVPPLPEVRWILGSFAMLCALLSATMAVTYRIQSKRESIA